MNIYGGDADKGSHPGLVHKQRGGHEADSLVNGERREPDLSNELFKDLGWELGHCFGMDHCVFYACNLQGTSGLEEDFRCPPYLCPICEAKLGYAVRERRNNAGEQWEYEKERMEALRDFCRRSGREKAVMWRALGAWTDASIPARDECHVSPLPHIS